jgi:hypothetical protein
LVLLVLLEVVCAMRSFVAGDDAVLDGSAFVDVVGAAKAPKPMKVDVPPMWLLEGLDFTIWEQTQQQST